MFFRSRRKKGQNEVWGYPPQIMDDEKDSFWLQTCKICKRLAKSAKLVSKSAKSLLTGILSLHVYGEIRIFVASITIIISY